VTGVVLAQETVNRFFYAGDAVPDTLDDVVADFATNVLTPISGCMNTNASFLNIVGQGVRGFAAFTSLGVSIQGTNGGDCLPPYAAWDFTLVRDGARERNGYKRIAGIGEGNQANGVASSGIVAALNTAAEAMFLSISDGTSEYNPVIRRTRVNRANVNPPQYWGVSNVIYSKIGTQNSRKYGHGR